MVIETVEDARIPGDWRVEAVVADGVVHVTRFAGGDNEQRARAYANWLKHPV